MGREGERFDMVGTSKAMTLTCCLGMKLQGLPAWKLKNGVAASKDSVSMGMLLAWLRMNVRGREAGKEG